MRATRRGKAVAGIAVGTYALALLFGARALNAVVVPAIVALVAAYLQVSAREDLRVRRETPADDFVGTGGTVALTFDSLDGEGLGRGFVGTVRDAVSDGLSVDGDDVATVDATVGSGEIPYEVRYESRGRQRFGPATVTATDVLGLFERELECRGEDTVLVYPPVYRLSDWGRRHLLHEEELGRSRERLEFEELREYTPGDPLRDIHWKTTAKRDDLVVKEFAAEVEAETVHVAANATAQGADDMAAAVASIALELTAEGVPVEVTTAEGSVTVHPDGGEQRRLLRLLAVVGAGKVSDAEADVVVYATGGRTTIAVGASEYEFSDLTGEVGTANRRGVSA